ncbi:hypothetical protein ACFSQE_11605 [Vogesella fluminis]|uniref:hypothetical protein n=1 Tax=Vogesella fluminis TaxID=1069161 RepID=UPI00362F8147
MLAMLLCFAGGALLNYKLDSRWDRFLSSATIGAQFEESQAWVDPHKWPYPLLADGKPVDVSAYERMAFLAAGLDYALQNPLGSGFPVRLSCMKSSNDMAARRVIRIAA